MNQEQRDRLTETYVAVTDALLRSPVPMYQVEMGKAPRLTRPWYLPAAPEQTVGQYKAALSRLSGLGLVKRHN